MDTDRPGRAPASSRAGFGAITELGGATTTLRVPSQIAQRNGAATKGTPLTRCLVLGGSGFVGSAIERRLKSVSPELEVRALSHPEIDVTKLEQLQQTFRSGDIVINSTGYANATDRSARGAALHHAVNAEGAKNVAIAARMAGAAKVIHISSVAAQGTLQGIGLTEDDRGEATSPYAISKRLGEELFLNEIGDVDYWIMRPTSIFGESRGLTIVLVQMSRFGVLPLPRGGRTLVPLCHVDNIAEAVMLAATTDRPGRATLTCGDLRSHRIGDVLKLLARHQGHGIRVLSVAPGILRALAPVANLPYVLLGRPPLMDEVRISTLTTDVEFNVSRAVHRLGYNPIVSLETGIERVVAATRLQERRS